MKPIVCTFCGHSDVNKDQIAKYDGECGKLEDLLKKAIIDLIQNHNVTEFYSSSLGKFDNMGARAVYELQKEKQYSHIKSIRVLNHVPTEKTNNEKDMESLYKFAINYHETIVCDNAEKVPPRARIPNCNKYMVNSADFVLACINRSTASGAYTTYKNAKKQNKTIINLLEFDD